MTRAELSYSSVDPSVHERVTVAFHAEAEMVGLTVADATGSEPERASVLLDPDQADRVAAELRRWAARCRS